MLKKIMGRTGNLRHEGLAADSTMARRRGIFTARLVGALMAVVLLGLLMGGRVFVSNQITDLRADIASLTDQREFLEGGQASLQASWNEATCARTIRARAREELNLVLPTHPGLALVRPPVDPARGTGLWRRMMDHLGGLDGDLAQAVPVERLTGAMVSLTPRSAVAAMPPALSAERGTP